jgi:hypothetical protein
MSPKPSADTETSASHPPTLLAALGGFFVGWLLGVIFNNIVPDLLMMHLKGHHDDGGVMFLAAYAIVLEVPILLLIRAMLGARRVGVKFSMGYGFACGIFLFLVICFFW